MSNTAVSFKIGADNTEALKALKELRDDFKNLRDQLKNTVTDIKVKVQADTASITSDVQNIKNQIKSQIGQVDVAVKINADTSSVTSSAGSIKSQLQAALGTVDIALNLSANMASIQSDITRIKNQIASQIGQVSINVDLDTSSIASNSTAIRNQISTALGTVEIPLKLSTNQTTLNADLLLIRNRINAYFATGVAVRIVPTITTADVAAARVRLRGLTSTTYQARLGINLTYLNSQIALARTMLNTLGSGVNINIDATASSLINALNELRDEVKRLRTAMSGSGGGGSGGGAGGNTGVLAGLRANIASLMAVATGGVFAAITVGTANYVRELERAAQLTNVTTQEMQELAYGASTVGFSMEKLSDVYKDVNDKVGDFLTTGGGEMADFFEKIAPKVGVTAEQFYNLSGPDALQLYVDSLQKANVSQAEMVFYMESIANDASVLLPLLKDGGAEFQRLAEQAQKLGIILDDVSIAKAKEFQKAFGQVKETVAGLTRTLGIELAPALTDISNRFVEFAVDNADQIRQAIQSIADVFNDILTVVDVVFSEIGSLWSDLTGSIEEGTGVQIGFFDLLSAAFQGVGLAFRTVAMLIKSLFEMIKYAIRERVLDIVAYFNEFTTGLDRLKANTVFALDILKISFVNFANVVRSALSFDWNGVVNNFNRGADQLADAVKKRQQQITRIHAEEKAKQQAIDEGRADNKTQLKTGMDTATGFVGDWFTRQFERNNKTNTMPSLPQSTKGFTGGGYVAPPAKDSSSGKTKSDNDTKREREAAEREAEALRRAEYEHDQILLKNKIENLEYQYEQEKISLDEFYDNKQKLITESSQLELNELLRRQAATKTESERINIGNDIIENTHKQMRAERDLAEQRKKDTEERIKKQEQAAEESLRLAITLAYSQGRIFDAREAEIKAKFTKLIADLKVQGKDADIEIAVKLQEIELNQNEADRALKRIDDAYADYDYQQNYLDIQKGRDPMGRGRYEKIQKDNSFNMMNQMTKDLEFLEQPDFANIEGVQEKIRELTLSIEELRIASQSPLEQFKIDLQETAISATESGLSNLFMDLVEGTKSAKEALKDFARSFIQSLAQVASQALSTYLVLSMLDAIYPGLGKATAATMSVGTSAIQNHDGGVVGIDGKDRNLGSPSDIKSNEVLTVLEKGEEVLTADDPRHRNNLDVDAYIARLIPRYHTGGIAGFAPDSEFMRTVENIEVQSQANRSVNLIGDKQSTSGKDSQPTSLQVTIINNNKPEELMDTYLKSAKGQKVVVNDVIGINTHAINLLLDE